MKKVISLFKRNYKSSKRLVYDEIVLGAEWVGAGEGVPTIKYDGTCCMIRDGKLHRRYDRKLVKSAQRRKKKDESFVATVDDFKPAPTNWEAAEDKPNIHTGHWPGLIPVDESNPSDKWHVEAFRNFNSIPMDGTYELVGAKVQGNPYNLTGHYLWHHGDTFSGSVPVEFEQINVFLRLTGVEGIVWHHLDGRMVKIKSRDFGINWPSIRTGD